MSEQERPGPPHNVTHLKEVIVKIEVTQKVKQGKRTTQQSAVNYGSFFIRERRER